MWIVQLLLLLLLVVVLRQAAPPSCSSCQLPAGGAAQSACQGKECFGKEGEVPALLGQPSGRSGQDRKCLPSTYTGRRHFVSVGVPE